MPLLPTEYYKQLNEAAIIIHVGGIYIQVGNMFYDYPLAYLTMYSAQIKTFLMAAARKVHLYKVS